MQIDAFISCYLQYHTQHVSKYRDRSTGFESNKNGRVRCAHKPKTKISV